MEKVATRAFRLSDLSFHDHQHFSSEQEEQAWFCFAICIFDQEAFNLLKARGFVFHSFDSKILKALRKIEYFFLRMVPFSLGLEYEIFISTIFLFFFCYVTHIECSPINNFDVMGRIDWRKSLNFKKKMLM